LFGKAAEQGYAEGEICLGLTYAKGRGVVQDAEQAQRLYAKGKAADKDGYEASYANTQGDLAEDEAQAVKWWIKAARLGSDGARSSLRLRGLRWSGEGQDTAPEHPQTPQTGA